MYKTAWIYMCGQTTQIPPRPSESPFDPIKHSSLLIPSANHIICCDHVDRQLMQEYQNLPIEKINIYLYQTTLYYFIIFSRGKLLLWANINCLNFWSPWALFFGSFFVKSEKVTTLSFVASIWPTRTSDYIYSNRWRNYFGDSYFLWMCVFKFV